MLRNRKNVLFSDLYSVDNDYTISVAFLAAYLLSFQRPSLPGCLLLKMLLKSECSLFKF